MTPLKLLSCFCKRHPIMLGFRKFRLFGFLLAAKNMSKNEHHADVSHMSSTCIRGLFWLIELSETLRSWNTLSHLIL